MSDRLQQEHHPDAIRLRLNQPPKSGVFPDAILGSIDGCITTFAIISGVMGAGLVSMVAVVLGFANLLADGFSMAISNYESKKAMLERRSALHKIEEQHIDEVPHGEREELRQIFERKGLSGPTLDQVVETICLDKTLWIETMLIEEYGLQKHIDSPVRAGAVTFLAFLLVGSLPLSPFLIQSLTVQGQFACSVLTAICAFFSIGALKGYSVSRPIVRSGLETLATGSVAALIAFGTSYGLNQYFGG